MRQLDLFGDYTPGPPAPPPAPEPEAPPPLPLPGVLPGQVGLFEPRSLLLGRARAAVAAAQLDEACRAIDALRERCPDDLAVAREASAMYALRERLARIDAPHARERARALLALARDLEGTPEPTASLARRLLVRVAAEVQRRHGDAGELEGKLPGQYLLEAGDVEEAQASLAAALAVRREARTLFLLADATFLRHDVAAARRLYLEALLLDPFDPALRAARDEAVRSLPGVVRDELEIEDEPEAWSAPAGILQGVFPRPARSIQGGAPPGLPEPPPGAAPFLAAEGLTPARAEALGRARAFVEALVAAGAARGDAVIAPRRAMKRLSPALFALYMRGLSPR